jgi:glycosyltransferase involved in cell wall biosynthesis
MRSAGVREARHILMTTDAVGGVWVYATMLARALAQQGDRITLVTLGPAPNNEQRAALADISRIDVIITGLALEWMDPAGEDRRRAAETLLSLAHELRPDVVHLNSYREGALAWPAPALVVAHSCVLSWWEACHGCLPDEPRWLAYAEAVEAGLRAADAWVAPTAAFGGTIDSLYAPPTRGSVIHNGIETDRPRAREKREIILAAGRVWDRAKNLGALLAASPGLPWPVEIAGPLNGPCGEVTPQNANVRFLGELPRSQLLALMREAAIYAAPASYEPFGLGILEAAHSGCALVLSDIPTLRELWDDAAMFVEPDNPENITAVLQLLCREPKLRSELQAAASARAEHYAIETTAAKYSALYDRLLGRACAPCYREARA